MAVKKQANYEEFFGRLEEGRIAPLLIVTGEEPLFYREILDTLKEKLSGENPEELSVQEWLETPGNSSDEQQKRFIEILDDLRTPSLFCRRRLLGLPEAKTLAEHCGEALKTFAQSAPEEVFLLLGMESIPAKSGLALLKKGVQVCTQPAYINPPDLIYLAQRRGRRKKLAFASGVLPRLIELLGETSQHLDGELEKLRLGVGEGQTVRMEDLGRILPYQKTYQGFYKLQQALISKDWRLVSEILHSFYTLGLTTSSGFFSRPEEVSNMALSNLGFFFRDLWRLADISSREGLRGDGLLRRANIFGRTYYAEWATRLPLNFYPQINRALLEGLFQLRDRTRNPRQIIELFCLGICRRQFSEMAGVL